MNVSYLLVFWQFFCLGLLILPFNVSTCSFYIPVVLVLMASFILLWTVFHNKIGNFNIVPDIKENCTLVTTGPYKYIRHPMYTSVTLIGLASMLYYFSTWKVAIFALLIFVLFFKAKREEGFWCAKTPEYKDFKKDTKMFIPFIL